MCLQEPLSWPLSTMKHNLFSGYEVQLIMASLVGSFWHFMGNVSNDSEKLRYAVILTVYYLYNFHCHQYYISSEG